jgi:hypothetical protein
MYNDIFSHISEMFMEESVAQKAVEQTGNSIITLEYLMR